MTDVPARLIVQRGPQQGEEHELTQSQLTIGRNVGNDIVFDDPEISRRHAQITREEGAYAVEDLGSTNGTFVNGRRIAGRIPLHNGDKIDFGETVRVTFRHGPLESPSIRYEPDDNAADKRAAVETSPEAYLTPPPSEPPAMKIEAADEIDDHVTPAPAEPRSNRRRLFLSCGCSFVIVLFLCIATLFFLDAYEQGRLLYCGPLRPFFEVILGPFGFSPACAQVYLPSGLI